MKMKYWIAVAALLVLSVGLVARSALPVEAAIQCGNPSTNVMPLKIYTQQGGTYWTSQVNAQVLRERTERALDLWASLPGVGISYVFVSSLNEADISVHFYKIGSNDNHGHAGCPAAGRQMVWLNSEIDHWDMDESDGVDADKISFDEVITHEFGHALGLAHHCPGGVGLMCPSVDTDGDGHGDSIHGQTTQISPEEAAMIASFYPSAGPTSTATNTVVPPTATSTPLPTSTASPTNTPQATNTPGSSPTMTPTPASTPVPWWCALIPWACRG